VTDPLEERIARLEQRLARIESLLATPPPLPVTSRPKAEHEPVVAPPVMRVEQPEELVRDGDRVDTPPPVEPLAAIPLEDVAGEDVLQPSRPPLPASPLVDYAQPVPPVAPGDFERTVGLKWAGWFGAIVLVIGSALLIKFAFDQGWLGNLPDVVKLLLMSLGGFTLLAAGEIVLRRVNPLSAVGLYGAGVAVLFLVGYAGHAWYDVYAQKTAFALMGAATLVGILVAARADLVSIAVLSLIGGHIVPIILRAPSTSAVPLLSYLLLLQIMALGLCLWQATPKWWVLRSVALVATVIWQLVLSVADGVPPDAAAAVSVFGAVFWTLFQAELALTALRASRRVYDVARPAEPGGLVFSILVTGLTTFVLLLAHDDASRASRGGIVLAVSAVCLLGGLLLWLTRQPSLAGLSASLRAQAAALLVLAVPVALDAENVVFGWLTLAIAFGLLAVWRRLAISAVASVVTWLLAVVALGHWVASAAAAHEQWLEVFGVAITAALVVSAMTVLVGHTVAALFSAAFSGFDGGIDQSAEAEAISAPVPASATDLASQVALVVHNVAAGLWAIAAIFQLSGLPGTIGLLAYTWLLAAASFRPSLARLAFIALAGVIVATVKWVVLDLLQARLSEGVAANAVFNRFQAVGLLIAASLAAIGWSRRSILLSRQATSDAGRLFRSALCAAVIVVMTFAMSVEIAAIVESQGVRRQNQTMHLGWTMLWTAAAVAVLLLDRRIFMPAEPTVGLLAAFTTIVVGVKYLLIDALISALNFYAADLRVVVNLQVLAGLVSVGGLIAVSTVWLEPPLRRSAQVLAVLLVLIMGSVEIDRYASYQFVAETWIVRQAGWSIWWSMFAVALVLTGFLTRTVLLRLFGLALFGLTLVKVVLVDLSGVGSGWRILSFFGLGLLLLGTSVLYGRHGSRLLADEHAPTAEPPAQP